MKILLLLNVLGFGLMLLLTLFLAKGSQRLQIIGWICLVFNLCVFAAPLCIMVSLTSKNICFLCFIKFFLGPILFLWKMTHVFTTIIYSAETSYKNQERGVHAISFIFLPDLRCSDVVLLWLSSQGLLHCCKCITNLQILVKFYYIDFTTYV